MSYEMNAEGVNGVNSITIIQANNWPVLAGDLILQVNAGPGLGGPASWDPLIQGVAGVQSIGYGNSPGLIGQGGANQGPGVVGIGSDPNWESPQVGFPFAGVLGIGGSDGVGVIGQAGAGTADGVQGFGSGTFSGVAGFGGDNAGTGVFGLGGAMGGQGVRGIGAGGPNTNPSPNAVGVYGQAGSGNADGVQGRGGGSFSGVAGFGDPTNDLGTGVFGLGGGKNGPGVRGIAGAAQNKQSPTGSGVGLYGNGDTGVVGESLDPFGVGAQGWGLVGLIGRNTSPTGAAVLGLCADYQGNTIPNSNAGAFVGNVIIDGNLQVTGTKSAVVPFPDGSHRQLYCLESPESWFEDFGSDHRQNSSIFRSDNTILIRL